LGNKINLNFEKSILLSNSILEFGKYRGEKASWVLMMEPSYIEFIINKLDYRLDGELLQDFMAYKASLYLHNRNEIVQELAEKELDLLDFELISEEMR